MEKSLEDLTEKATREKSSKLHQKNLWKINRNQISSKKEQNQSSEPKNFFKITQYQTNSKLFCFLPASREKGGEKDPNWKNFHDPKLSLPQFQTRFRKCFIKKLHTSKLVDPIYLLLQPF